jgi:hypothetical protein
MPESSGTANTTGSVFLRQPDRHILRLRRPGGKILDFMRYYNATMAKPFRWTYQGKPLAA